ncbi:right-handed parallel beta-helix repeat-containing protein [Flavobacterium agrisoli]|uniref:Right-handed parallel beta-helix repeat-containing protein n=1 Tax=Flavobacterium agrisoli TaxID=2793066 RepID=A0A934PRJ0_9FLAO|nr:right-handed parallel beta-helix repeat-containing protein [Flavobacterium agrisoli]MBK0371286.1 right-handed parallel beta-helix repeat-containing protein [Flavobacterium agrisoli]
MKKLFVCACIFLNTLLFAQFKYNEVPLNYIKTVDMGNDYLKYLHSAYDLAQVLPKGFVKDGSIEYTEYIQSALNKYKIVKLPNFPLAVNNKGLSLSSNSVLIFDKNSELIMIPNNKNGYSLIQIVNKNNVKIYSPKLTGERDKHFGVTGEWGMGISVKNSDSVWVFNCNIKNFWGDGIYIGGVKCSSNINISGGFLDNNRRNGISIINGDKISLNNLVISNSNGINPMTGIDIEPNDNSNILSNIFLDNIITYNNGISGLSMYLGRLKSLKINVDIGIFVNNYRDIYSKRGISFSNVKSSKLKELGGEIKLSNFYLIGNKVPIAFLFHNTSLDNIVLSMKNFNILHKDKTKYMNDIKEFQEKKIIYNRN